MYGDCCSMYIYSSPIFFLGIFENFHHLEVLNYRPPFYRKMKINVDGLSVNQKINNYFQKCYKCE